jgi:secreted PhoX family phosphatase
MGDDRRSGHVWKFVSDSVVTDPTDPNNRRLLEKGTLYAAKFNPDFTGRWIPLAPHTPLARPDPRHCPDGFLNLPRRPAGGHVAVGYGEKRELPVYAWIKTIEQFTTKPYAQCTLKDLVRPALAPSPGTPREGRGEGSSLSTQDSALRTQSLLLLDAYAMATAAGATPTARPEDIEVHPVDRTVYISFTDSTGSPTDGSPDSRIFPDSRKKNSRQYGAIYRIVEDADDPAAATFAWGKFVASGEAADGGGGFACADNLVFDPAANLWMVCDITTPAHNFPVNNRDPKDPRATPPGHKNFPGVFGNNAMFVIPTTGPLAGVPHCFGIGPMECELTGPTFADDGHTLFLSVQHPGELHGTRNHKSVKQPPEETRSLHLAARDGTIFEQQRKVPLGSNFPTKTPGTPPLPCVVVIRRA